MTRGIGAASAIQFSARTRPANFVWISDELLAGTFARFCQRRHGSCVPGPLEARRRAAKRKNTSLASQSWSPVPLDPALLSGRDQHVSWWQSDKKVNSVEPKTPKWLSWLLESQPSPSAPHAQSAKQDTVLWDSLDNDWLAGILSQYTTFHDIQEALQQRRVSAEQRPKLCQQVLSHLLKHENWAPEVAQLLLDPEFHPPGSSLHLEAFSQLDTLPLSEDSWLRIRNSLCDASRLGIVPIDDIRKIIESSCGRSLRLADSASIISLEANEIGLLPELVKAIYASSILSLEDIGISFILDSLRKSSINRNASTVLSILAPWAEQRHASTYSYYAVDEILHIKADSPQAEATTISSTARFLSTLNSRVLALTLLQVTEQLCLVSSKKGLSGMTHLANWRTTLSELGRPTKDELLEEGHFSTMLSHLGDEKGIRGLLMTMWTCVSLANSDEELEAFLHEDNVRRVIRQEMEGTNGVETNDPFGRFTLELSKLPLPNKGFLLEKILPFIHHRSPAAASDPYLEMLIKGLVDRRYVILSDRGHFQSLWRNYPYELVDFAESINPHLHLFKGLSRKWLYKDDRASGVVLKLLRHNHALKLALSQLSLDPDHVPFRIAWLREKTHSIDRLPDPHEALEFIKHLAVSFATTKIDTPSTCDNHLNWLYLFLHRYRCPVPPILVQGLWYTGLVRPGRSEFSSATMERVLYRVSQVEGPDVARQLECDPAFRAQYQRNFEAYAQQDDPDFLAKHYPEVDYIDDLYWAQGSHWMKDRSSLLDFKPDWSPGEYTELPDTSTPLPFPRQRLTHGALFT
ncbi:hypothetical protein PV10_07536 [Exophiala mesophila]|uniref:Uncharacterized protein n=1 Tax=Exophiala mesophila TaxID=212818 RepID=A0A0D1XQ18_EXOME|nr:uncharacterized protein PV10_07536 [Exophiala mesophila]KIV90206.1 hypothetical protein PV10_07536 [Exophiala mesophila]